MSWRVLEADCVEAMREMDEASVDAIVTDPPYGLEFMGKEWDRLVGDSGHGNFRARDRKMKEAPETEKGNPWASERPSYGMPKKMPRCANCNGWRYSGWKGNLCQCEEPNWIVDTSTYPRKSQEWHQAWATEALRVLKPGGFLLAFGGTRTYHRLACAVEDAGFEIRDSVIWLYGSGFPKSLAVDKAIDKAAGAERKIVGERPIAYPDSDTWGTPSTGRGEIWTGDGELATTRSVTAPATAEAQRWQGWGTALKPAHEIVVCGRKPDPSEEWRIIDGNLCELRAKLLSLSPASPADESSGSKPVEHDEGLLATAQWSADECTNTRDDLLQAMDTSAFESALATSLNIVSSWRNTLGALYELTNTSTTETESSTTTDLRTLKSCLSDLTPRSIVEAATKADGSGLAALPAATAFSAVASTLNGTLTLSALARATSQDRTCSPDEAARPAHEPIVVARKPLIGTVAQNVERFGTGALNIDGCRIGTDERWEGDERPCAGDNGFGPGDEDGWSGNWSKRGGSHDAGRWPANVALSCTCPDDSHSEPTCVVAELDRQSGEAVTGGRGSRGQGIGDGYHGSDTDWDEARGYDDSVSGASRFFYVAKASRAERNAGLEGFEERLGPGTKRSTAAEGRASALGAPRANHHPTVKPVELMRWLCRLVTPPDGTILDPFAGSGTTGIAAVLEGFDFIGIERDESYVEIAKARIAWWDTHKDRAEEILSLSAKSERERTEHRDAGQMSLEDAA